jgi:hypothetical protein
MTLARKEERRLVSKSLFLYNVMCGMDKTESENYIENYLEDLRKECDRLDENQRVLRFELLVVDILFIAILVVLAWTGRFAFAQEVITESVRSRDSVRLAVSEQQDSFFRETGHFAQVARSGELRSERTADSLVLSSLIDDAYEVYVYEAPCGQGYSVISYSEYACSEYSTSTDEYVSTSCEDRHVFATGCAADRYTSNW